MGSARVAIAYLSQRGRDFIWRRSLIKHRDSSQRAPSPRISWTEYSHSRRIRRRREMRHARVVADEARREPRNSGDRAQFPILNRRKVVFAQYRFQRGFRRPQYKSDARSL